MSNLISHNSVTCLILASGYSQRFGSGNKMLQPLTDGRCILQTVIQTYQSVVDIVSVVTRDDDVLVHRLANDLNADTIINRQARQGMSQSIVSGVSNTSPSVGWLIGLGDMPFVISKTCRDLVARADPASIVLPRSENGVGNPVVFGVDFRDQLMALTGDQGARSLVYENLDNVVYLDSDNQGIHQDIDTKEDLACFNQG